MQYEWDEQKRLSNLNKHGLDFVDAEEVFRGPVFSRPDRRHEYGEERWQGIGQVRGRAVVLVWVVRPPDRIRIISMRKAVKHEREAYARAVSYGLGQG
ncbi:MAG: BrnT family toxin [Peptococcaceae bacterium]|jgi:uncharacterized DUF497 family protein|nr:BrnT family toxin [Peptococcaceae bacterium]